MAKLPEAPKPRKSPPATAAARTLDLFAPGQLPLPGFATEIPSQGVSRKVRRPDARCAWCNAPDCPRTRATAAACAGRPEAAPQSPPPLKAPVRGKADPPARAGSEPRARVFAGRTK
jgi:hypothetical protein